MNENERKLVVKNIIEKQIYKVIKGSIPPVELKKMVDVIDSVYLPYMKNEVVS